MVAASGDGTGAAYTPAGTADAATSATPTGLRAVGQCVLDDLCSDRAAERESAFGGTAEMDPGPDARGAHLFRARIEKIGVAREQVREHRPCCPASSGMPGWVVRDRVGRDDSGYGRIKLVRVAS